MGTLKEKFEELSAGIKAFGKPAAAWFPKYTSTSFFIADYWWTIVLITKMACLRNSLIRDFLHG